MSIFDYGAWLLRAPAQSRTWRRDVGPLEFLFISVGSIIGSGWLLGAFRAAQVAGPAAIWSWVVGALAILILAAIHAELGGFLPYAGGNAIYPFLAFGSLAGMVSGWMAYLAAVAVGPTEVVAALTYASNFVPGLLHQDGTLTFPNGFVVAAIGLLGITLVNLKGVGWLTNINSSLVAWKILVPCATVLALLVYVHHFDNLTTPRGDSVLFIAAPNHPQAIFAALSAGVIFSFLGFEQAIQFGAESKKNARRALSLAVLGSWLIGSLIFISLAIAFTTSVDPRMLAHGWRNLAFPQLGPYAVIATGLGLLPLAVALYIDAFVSPSGTALIFVGSSARVAFAMARSQYLPPVFSRLNRSRVPWMGLLVAGVLGVLFLLPFSSWVKLVNILTSATVISYGMQPLALIALRNLFPEDAPYKREFNLPYPPLTALIGFTVANLLLYWSGWDANWKLMAAIILGIVLFTCIRLILQHGRPHDHLEMRAAVWIVLWLVGMTVISYVGSFGHDSVPVASLNLLPFGWDAVVVSAFSVVIFVLAYLFRQSKVRALDYAYGLSEDDVEKLNW